MSVAKQILFKHPSGPERFAFETLDRDAIRGESIRVMPDTEGKVLLQKTSQRPGDGQHPAQGVLRSILRGR